MHPFAGAPIRFANLPHGGRVSGMRRSVSRALLLLFGCGLGGCAAVDRVAPQTGMAERCARFMTEAYPGAAFDIKGSQAAATSLTTIVAKVEAVRTDLPANAAVPHRLAVECRFDNGVLTGFRWTKGPT
jgi:hypothetical protein